LAPNHPPFFTIICFCFSNNFTNRGEQRWALGILRSQDNVLFFAASVARNNHHQETTAGLNIAILILVQYLVQQIDYIHTLLHFVCLQIVQVIYAANHGGAAGN
jgi:hypothetical protein